MMRVVIVMNHMFRLMKYIITSILISFSFIGKAQFCHTDTSFLVLNDESREKLYKSVYVNFSGANDRQAKLSIYKDSVVYDCVSTGGDIFPKKHYKFSVESIYGNEHFALLHFRSGHLIISNCAYVFLDSEFGNNYLYMQAVK